MMITPGMNASLNRQIGQELAASHGYLSMAFSFESMGLKIFAKRFMQQAEEERGHALKIAKYIHDVGGTVTLEAVAKPKGEYSTAKAIVKAAVESELAVTNSINKLVAQADKESDYATRSFLQWFVDEQVEEVSSMTELSQWVAMAGENNLFQLEARIAQAMA